MSRMTSPSPSFPSPPPPLPVMTTSNPDSIPLIDAKDFYTNYFGHPPYFLKQLITTKPSHVPTIYLVGDSTLDNKYWIPNHEEDHPNPHFRAALSTNVLCRDISYWLARLYDWQAYTPMNCAVEQTTLRQRLKNGLYPQDELVRDHIDERDVLVVSLGGNDIALEPTLPTILAVLGSVYLGGEWGMSSLKHLFRDQLQRYISQLISKRKPRLIVVCMLYFPDETVRPSWAGTVLRLLSYNSSPRRLQGAVERVYERAVKNITVEGCHVVFAPFFSVLDGKTSAHYVERAEPSEEGGRLMAELLKRVIDGALQGRTENVG